ncbi:glycosyltransferase family 39 protein [Vibrio breoganii]
MALYTTWLLSNGKTPNVDFNVDSYTLLFDILQPIYQLTGSQFELIYIFRFIFLILLSYLSYQLFTIVKHLFSDKVAYTSILMLFLSYAMISRGLDIRPDLIILILWLQSIITLYISEHRESKKFTFVGIFLSLAILFKFKAFIVIVVIIHYIIMQRRNDFNLKLTVSNLISLLFGALIPILALFFINGTSSLSVFYETTLELIKLSIISHSQENVSSSIRSNVLLSFIKVDSIYYLLVVSGFLMFIKTLSQWQSSKRNIIISLLLLALFSVYLNPHYHSYNLITLYSILIVFVGISLNKLLSSNFIGDSFKKLVTIMVIAIFVIRFLMFILSNTNEHQRLLYTFINNNTKITEPIFAYEGIGLYRESTYHWRSSAIKTNDYYSGLYNVWQEIEKTKPIIIIESYRVPGWLTISDRKLLYNHYVTISPHVLTLGFSTNTSENISLIRSGLYTIDSNFNVACHVNNAKLYSGETIWLDNGEHSLSAKGGNCMLHWYFSNEAISSLRDSNPNSLPYLISP